MLVRKVGGGLRSIMRHVDVRPGSVVLPAGLGRYLGVEPLHGLQARKSTSLRGIFVAEMRMAESDDVDTARWRLPSVDKTRAGPRSYD